MRRLFRDLIAMRTDSLVGPWRSVPHRGALLLCPAEFKERSKIRGCDEGVILKSPMRQPYGSTFPARQRAFRPRGRALSGAVEGAVGMERHTVSNTTRCSISCDRCERHGLESEFQAPLRLVSAPSTARRLRHVCHLAELQKVRALARWAELRETVLLAELRGQPITSNGVCSLLRNRYRQLADNVSPKSALASVS